MASDPFSLLVQVLALLGVVMGLGLSFSGFWLQGAFLSLFGFLSGGLVAVSIILTQDVDVLPAIVVLAVFCMLGGLLSLAVEEVLLSIWGFALAVIGIALLETGSLDVLVEAARVPEQGLTFLLDPVLILLSLWCAYLAMRLHRIVMLLVITGIGAGIFSVGLWGLGATSGPVSRWTFVVFLLGSAVQFEMAVRESRRLFPQI